MRSNILNLYLFFFFQYSIFMFLPIEVYASSQEILPFFLFKRKGISEQKYVQFLKRIRS